MPSQEPTSTKIFWRISNYLDLTGEGGRISSARWHTEGRRVVYLAESPAAAIVERLVQVLNIKPDGILPRSYQLLRILVAADLEISELEPPFRVNWKENEALTRSLGDAWLSSQQTCLASVPSAVAPYTWNYLLNPEHPDAGQVRIAEVVKERFDNRLFRSGGL